MDANDDFNGKDRAVQKTLQRVAKQNDKGNVKNVIDATSENFDFSDNQQMMPRKVI